MGKKAIELRYGKSNEYRSITQNVPKFLSLELIRWATDILFLGKEFMESAKFQFSKGIL